MLTQTQHNSLDLLSIDALVSISNTLLHVYDIKLVFDGESVKAYQVCLCDDNHLKRYLLSKEDLLLVGYDFDIIGKIALIEELCKQMGKDYCKNILQ